MHKVPVGVSDFSELISKENDYLFVDKTLLIKELIDRGAKTTLITRARRWGKTLNMSMLRYFFAPHVMNTPTHALFNSLAIVQIERGKYMQFQGQYPVIFLSFKDIRGDTLKEIREAILILIRDCYDEHAQILSQSENLSPLQKKNIQEILLEEVSDAQLKSSLLHLSQCLYKHYQKKVYILIDEYDTPINSAPPVCREAIIQFMGGLFSQCLKDNPYLEKAVITGILRIAKANIFSGLNNLSENSLLHNTYQDSFGFSEREIEDLFKKQGMPYDLSAIRQWYNGYQHGNAILYNPWSIINYIDQRTLGSYWVDSGNNTQINNLFDKAPNEIKENLSELIQGKTISVPLEKYITFNNLEAGDPSALWSLLLNSGYLTGSGTTTDMEDSHEDEFLVKIPNREVKSLYIKYAKEWIQKKSLNKGYNQFIDSLITGEIEKFEQELKDFLMASFSYFDTGGHNPEKVYHSFLLGLVADLHKTYAIKSNRESGTGRYDLLLMPKNPNALGIILEFKSVDRHTQQENLKKAAREALTQIKERHYNTELKQFQIHNRLYIAIAFAGKELEMVYDRSEITLFFNAAEQRQAYLASKSPQQKSLPSTLPPELLSTSDWALRHSSTAIEARKTIVGNFEDQEIVFEVCETLGDGSCGFHCLPAQYTRGKVTELFLKHSSELRIRKALSSEIFEAFQTRHLPNAMFEKYATQLEEYHQYLAKYDVEQQQLLKETLDNIDPARTLIPDRKLENVIDFLKDRATQTPAQIYALKSLLDFQKAHDNAQQKILNFFSEEAIYRDFVTEYIGGRGHLSFSVGSPTFEAAKSLLDVLLEIVTPPIQVYIWEPMAHDPKRAKIVYKGGTADTPLTHMLHQRGLESHFELMVEADVPMLSQKSQKRKNEDHSSATTAPSLLNQFSNIIHPKFASHSQLSEKKQKLDSTDKTAAKSRTMETPGV